MPNSPSPNNIQRGLRVPRQLDARVLKKFRVDETMTIKDAYILALQFATRDVVLNSHDYLILAAASREAEQSMNEGENNG